MKDNQEQNEMQKRLTEKEALKFLAGRKPRAKMKPAAPARMAAAKNRKIREHSENVMKPDDVLIANIGGKRVALNEAMRKEIIEFVLSLGEEAEEKEEEKEKAKEAFTAGTLKTQRKNTGITIIFVHGRCTHKKAAQL